MRRRNLNQRKLLAGLAFMAGLFLVAFPAVFSAAFASGNTGSHLYHLDNGLSLLVLPRPDEPLVHLDVYLSLRGAARNAGLAHLVEHLKFSRTEGAPAGSLADSLQLLTVANNAATSSRYIRTENTCLPALLPRLLRLEAERFGRLDPDSLSLEFERERILGEHDWRHERSRSGAAVYRLLAMAYGDGPAGGDPRLGSRDDIQSLTMADVRNFLTDWFRPDRMVISIYGPVRPEEVREQVAVTLGALPLVTGDQPADDPPPEVETSSTVEVWDRSEQDMLAVAFRLPHGTFQEMALVQLTNTIMRQENGHPILLFFEDEALLILRVWGRWGKHIADEEAAGKAREQFWEEVHRVRYRVKNDWLYDRNKKAHLERIEESLAQPAEGQRWRAQLLTYDRDLPTPEDLLAMVDTLSQESIQDFFSAQLTPEKAFDVFYAGRDQDDGDLSSWNRRWRNRINPYLNRREQPLRPGDLPPARILPVLRMAGQTTLGRVHTSELPNGLAFHQIMVPGADKIALGVVRPYPWLEDEAAGRNPGRLAFYEGLVNAGYDNKGAARAPRGKKLTWSTRIQVGMEGIQLRAEGPRSRAGDVAAALVKRIEVGRLNPYGLKWVRENYKEWKEDQCRDPRKQARRWRLSRLPGEGHPLTAWLFPDREALTGWSAREANSLHSRLMQTDNMRVLCVGPEPAPAEQNPVSRAFARLDEAEDDSWLPAEFLPAGVSGGLVDAPGSEVAIIELTFPAFRAPDSGLDSWVLEILLEQRLDLAAFDAGLDSVDFQVDLDAFAGGVGGELMAVCRPAGAPSVLDFLRQEVMRLSREPLTAEEEALARLAAMGRLVGLLGEAESARNIFLEWGMSGALPQDPLGCLGQDEMGRLAEMARRFFPAEHYSWTVLGDADHPALAGLAESLEP